MQGFIGLASFVQNFDHAVHRTHNVPDNNFYPIFRILYRLNGDLRCFFCQMLSEYCGIVCYR